MFLKWLHLLLGGYETGHAEYKHFYFNCNKNTAIIWTITVVALLGLYEGAKSICKAIYLGKKKKLRVLGAARRVGSSSSILAIYEVGSCVGKLDINSHYTSPTHFLLTAPLQACLLATIYPLL